MTGASASSSSSGAGSSSEGVDFELRLRPGPALFEPSVAFVVRLLVFFLEVVLRLVVFFAPPEPSPFDWVAIRSGLLRVGSDPRGALVAGRTRPETVRPGHLEISGQSRDPLTEQGPTGLDEIVVGC